MTARVALVTGAGAGIGRAVARALAAAGDTVVVTDVDPRRAEEVAAGLPGARAYGLDAGDPASWRAVAAQVLDLGRVDVVVNNAYTLVRAPAHETAEDEWDRQLAVDLSAVYHSVRAFLPALRDAGGCLVNVASVHALVGLPGHPAYAAAKGGMLALTRQLAVEYGPRVRVNAVVPGPVLTSAWDDVDAADLDRSARATVLGRLGRPEEVAAAVCFLASGQASFITGTALVVDGGWTASKDSA